MSVTLSPISKIGTNTWRFSWTSTLSDPTFTIYLDGRVYLATEATTLDIVNTTSQGAPAVEIRDDDVVPSQITNPGTLSLLFYSKPNDYSLHQIFEYVGSSWVQRGNVLDTGMGYMVWKTQWLADDTVSQWKIVPLDAARNAGTPILYTALVVRNPDVPNVTITANSDLSLTFTGA